MIRLLSRVERALARMLLAIGVAGGLAACATQSGTVVLLPEKDGRSSAVTVRQGDQTLVLDQPYAAANLTSTGPQARLSNADDVNRRFSAALAAQPARPRGFTLYFVEQTDTLTDESQRLLDNVVADINRHPVPDIVVVGHTDLVGSDAFNDVLARKRAETVQAVLTQRGIAPENIIAIGRGKREPVVPTADGVAEPRNRRVEIVVR
jgi:outer membrane protein OmpA-like peptidoglycan-associated protein